MQCFKCRNAVKSGIKLLHTHDKFERIVCNACAAKMFSQVFNMLPQSKKDELVQEWIGAK